MSTLQILVYQDPIKEILTIYEISSKLELSLGILSFEFNFQLKDLLEVKEENSNTISTSRKVKISDVLNVDDTFNELHQKIKLHDLPEKVIEKIKDIVDLFSVDDIRKWVIRKVCAHIAELAKTLNKYPVLTSGKISIGPEFDLQGIKIILKLTNEFKKQT